MVCDDACGGMFQNNELMGMFQRNSTFVMYLIISVLLLSQSGHSLDVQPNVKTATACYGTINNFLRLECAEGYYIRVEKVIHAAKLKSAGCKSPAYIDTYRRECCKIDQKDCKIEVLHSQECENKSNCERLATWSNTNKDCDQDEYPQHTNYMIMEYVCLRRGDLLQIATTASTSLFSSLSSTSQSSSSLSSSSLSSSSLSSSSLSSSTAPSTTTFTSERFTNSSTTFTTKAPAALVQPGNNTDELSDAMIGAIVGGVLGMLLTFVIFIFYWGRKRRLRIVGKPQPSVWDYLLSQTFTVRGAKGYDHFSSVRSSTSSDPNSPVIRKNMWLPNITNKDNEAEEDIISNYNNDMDRNHRVEIYHNASPSPYAVLDLNVNSLRHDNHSNIHEV